MVSQCDWTPENALYEHLFQFLVKFACNHIPSAYTSHKWAIHWFYARPGICTENGATRNNFQFNSEKKKERVGGNLVCVLRHEKKWEIKIESDFEICN